MLARIRRACLALPETSERPSHGAPTFFYRGRKSFVTYMDNHHGDGRLAIWCAAPPGVQAVLVGTEPDLYFVPPYVGVRGWIGVRLDRDPAWEDVHAAIAEAHRAVAGPKPGRSGAR